MKPTNKDHSNIRIPRPLGLTTLSKAHQAQNTESSKSTVIHHILTNYITTGFTFLGIPCTIPQLSQLTSIPQPSILKGISKASTGLASMTNPDQLQDTIRALQSVSINQSLQASGRMHEQSNILRASQGNEYKAFISSTYNIALKNELDASKQLMELAKALMPSQGTTINIQNNQNQGTEKAVSPADVVYLIEQKEGRINPSADTDNKDRLWLEYDLGNMPEVDARKQTDKGTNEGLGLKNLTDLHNAEEVVGLEVPTKADKVPNKDHHATRREAEYGIDPEADQV